MSFAIFYEPRVTVISKPQFIEPDHLKVEQEGEFSDAEKLIEYGGRICYMSQRNPAKRTTGEYINNILKQGHGSVLEHANFSLLLEGISRSCSHELVRHRAGFSYSQLSQRYVDESECAFVIPPAIIGTEEEQAWIRNMKAVRDQYSNLVDKLSEKFSTVEDKTLRRKMAREAARSVLPNATETKIVVTGNVRAWRNMLELRTSLGAEKEIRRLALKCLEVLKLNAPSLFEDFQLLTSNGEISSSPTYKKV